jgi:hypothetical protein
MMQSANRLHLGLVSLAEKGGEYESVRVF